MGRDSRIQLVDDIGHAERRMECHMKWPRTLTGHHEWRLGRRKPAIGKTEGKRPVQPLVLNNHETPARVKGIEVRLRQLLLHPVRPKRAGQGHFLADFAQGPVLPDRHQVRERQVRRLTWRRAETGGDVPEEGRRWWARVMVRLASGSLRYVSMFCSFRILHFFDTICKNEG
jgi:hypothetical protein